MKWILLIGCLVQLPFLVVVVYDILYESLHNLRRYHIGRWTNRTEWKKAVKSCAQKWLLNPPVISAVDESQYRLVKKLKGQGANTTIQSWQKAGLALGILSSCDTAQDRELLSQWERQLINQDGCWKMPLKKVDWAMLGYALLKQSKYPNERKRAADQVLYVLMDNLCEDGMISYSQGKASTIRFVDTLGMVCPFLAMYGRLYHEPEIVALAVKQIELFRETGLYEKTNLPCHAYDAESKLPLGVYGWGRGIAWYTIALVDTWRELPDGNDKQKLQAWIKDAAEAYIPYQKPDGAYYTILQGSGQYDSSATAAMAYFYHVCAEIFNAEKYGEISRKCLDRLMLATMRDGAIDQCQGDTHGIGIFSQNFDVMPFVQGLVLRSLN
ncbi:MAG: glycoside hydrolase family 88 protein [Lachnospiraceae bacterium]